MTAHNRSIGFRCGQLDQVDAAIRPCEELPNIWPFMASGVVPNHMDQSLVRVARLDLGEQLRGTGPVHGGWLDKGRVEVRGGS